MRRIAFVVKRKVKPYMLTLCTLASGSSGNSTYISDGETHMLIDAGISARAITTSLSSLGVKSDEISAILITHEHWDHIRGLEVFEKKKQIPIYAAGEGTADAIVSTYPQLQELITRFCENESFYIGKIKITPFRTPHDTSWSVGFRLESGGSCVVYLTDLGYVPEPVRDRIDGAQLVLLEANYDEQALKHGPYPPMLKRRIAGERGHLSNSDCAECALYAAQHGVQYLVLGHLSKENNTPKLAYDTVHRRLMENGIIPGVDIMLQVAPRSECGHVYTIEDSCEGVKICVK